MDVRRIEAAARDLALQSIAVGIMVAWPFKWLDLPAREAGLALGALVGVGNVLRWVYPREEA